MNFHNNFSLNYKKLINLSFYLEFVSYEISY